MSTGREGVVAGSARAVFEGSTSIGMDDDQLLGWFIATRSAVAFEALVARHGPMVLGVCRGASRDEPDAQDAFQATFLVLARRAGSIRRRGALAAWLYGVARKIALRARTDAARRRIREREAAARAAAAVGSGRHPADADVEALLEEIDRLPGTYREPIILCYLDGMTYEAAAAHLDCPLGTLSIRLKRARERLRARLTRRGVGIPAGLLAANLGSGVPPVALPAGLNGLAVRAAMAWTTNQATAAGTVPTSVALMAARTMTTMRNQVFAVGLFALGGVAATAAAALALKPTAPPQATRPEPPQAPAPRSWVRAFPNGTTVELVGISAHPSNPGSWRTPDGVPLATPPYHHAAYRAKTEGIGGSGRSPTACTSPRGRIRASRSRRCRRPVPPVRARGSTRRGSGCRGSARSASTSPGIRRRAGSASAWRPAPGRPTPPARDATSRAEGWPGELGLRDRPPDRRPDGHHRHQGRPGRGHARGGAGPERHGGRSRIVAVGRGEQLPPDRGGVQSAARGDRGVPPSVAAV